MSHVSIERRLNRVFEHIEQHLGETVDLAHCAQIALLSKYHCSRMFSAYFGLGMSRLSLLCRLHRAAHQLCYRVDVPITQIAHASGYENAESFSRIFQQIFQQTPSAFRATPHWGAWQEHQRLITRAKEKTMSPTSQNTKVNIVQLARTPIAMMLHQGSPQKLHESLSRFIAWRKSQKLHPGQYDTYNLLFDDPEETLETDYRFGIATQIPDGFDACSPDMQCVEIPSGTYAQLVHKGSDDGLACQIRYLYGEWAPQSGYELADFPIVLKRVLRFPDVPAHLALTEVYLPLL